MEVCKVQMEEYKIKKVIYKKIKLYQLMITKNIRLMISKGLILEILIILFINTEFLILVPY